MKRTGEEPPRDTSERIAGSALTAADPAPSNRLQQPASWRKYSMWLIVAAIFVALALIIIWLTTARKKPEEETAEEIVVSVRVAKAERGEIAAEVSAIGTIVPREVATVSAKLNSQIKQMPLLKNKTYRAGEIIATLEARDIAAQRAEAAAALKEAELNARVLSTGTIPETAAQDEKALRDAQANVANARAVYERRRTLYEQGGISKKELDASQLALTTAENDLRLAESAARLHQTATNPNNRAAAEARIKQAQERLAAIDTQLSYATIRAPFAGVVTEQFQYEGEYAAAGAKLFTIADVSEVIVKAPFADTVAAQLKEGDAVTVLPQGLPGESLTGNVSLISHGSDSQSRTVEVWVKLKNEGGRLRADGAAKVIVATQSASDAVIVPTAAVTLDATNADEGTVMVVDEQAIAHEAKVKVGIRAGDRAQILEGLKGGETIVIEGNYALPDGKKVEITEGEADEKNGATKDKAEKKGDQQ